MSSRWRCAALAATQAARKRKDVALILPDFCTRIAVLDFDNFPSDPKEQALAGALPREAQRAVRRGIGGASATGRSRRAGKKVDVVVVMAPLEIVSRYEAPFRAAGTESGAGDDFVDGRAGPGARGRAERAGETHRTRAHRAGARQERR